MYYVIKAGIIPNYLLFMVYENEGLKEKKKAFFALPVTALRASNNDNDSHWSIRSKFAWQVIPKRFM